MFMQRSDQARLSSPITIAVKQALLSRLRHSIPSESKIKVFSYSADFSVLWELDGRNTIHGLSSNDFVIVIDDGWNRQGDLPEASRFLTVLDWAVWVSLSHEKTDEQSRPDLPTIVLLRSNEVSQSSDSDAERFWATFKLQSTPTLPWIHIVPLIGRAGELCCLMQLLQVIKGKKSSLPYIDLSMIQQVWQSFFLRPSQPSDNHSLSNLLGAGLLTGDFGDSPIRLALMKMMQTLGLLPKVQDKSSTPIRLKRISEATTALHAKLPEEAHQQLQFLLVDDDHYRHGWGAFVAKCLGFVKAKKADGGWEQQIGSMQCRLTTMDSAVELLERMNISQIEPNGMGSGLGNDIDMLFLDLRLFERHSLSVEARFFISVIQQLRIVNNLGAPMAGDWPGVDGDELQRLESWCNLAIQGSNSATRNDKEYIDSLTLFPRLVSILNIDLPIILFSSTQRRRVTEVLKSYGNIITTFSKPTLQLGNSEQLVEETLANFERTTVAAMEMVQAKRLRRLLIAEEFPVFWRKHDEGPIDPIKEKTDYPWSIQLLIDESGKPEPGEKKTKLESGEPEPGNKKRKLKVGGFLVVIPPGLNPATVNDRIYQKFPKIREKKKIVEKISKKDKLRDEILSTLQEVIAHLKEFEVRIFPISIDGKLLEAKTAHSAWKASSFIDEMVEDNLHREMMRCLIELGLYVFARQILPASATVEFHFHAGTRRLPVNKEESEALNNTWGIRTLYEKALHFDHNSARPLVEEVSREYRRSIFEPQPMLARAYGLNTEENQAEIAKVHALHYLADSWLFHRDKPDMKKRFRDNSLRGNYDSRFSQLLEAHRHLAHGRIAKAVAIGAPVAVSIPAQERSQAVNSIVVALQDAARSMTGSECLALASALQQRIEDKSNFKVMGTVHSISEKDGCVEIAWGGKIFQAKKTDVSGNVSVGEHVQFVRKRGRRLHENIAQSIEVVKRFTPEV